MMKEIKEKIKDFIINFKKIELRIKIDEPKNLLFPE
jgi:acyl carrier protein